MSTKKSENLPATAKKKLNAVDMVQADQFKKRLSGVASKLIDPNKFLQTGIMVIQRTPNLLDCDPLEVVRAMLDSAQCGLIPDGKYAHLVPYKSKCQFIPDWKGLVMLGMRSDEVRRWRTDVVCQKDDFVYDRGRVEKHQVHWDRDRGEPVAFYSELIYENGETDVEVVTVAEAKAIQNRSAAGTKGPWVTDFTEMGRKTAVKRHAKRLGHLMTDEFNAAVDLDADRLRDVTGEVEVGASPADMVNDTLSARKTEKRVKEEPSAEEPVMASEGQDDLDPASDPEVDENGPHGVPRGSQEESQDEDDDPNGDEGENEPPDAPDAPDEDEAERKKLIAAIQARTKKIGAVKAKQIRDAEDVPADWKGHASNDQLHALLAGMS